MTMTRKCTQCESRKGLVRFEGETFVITHAAMTAEVEGLSGWRCEACGEVEFDPACAERYAAPGDILVMRARIRQGTEDQ
jgi:HTH-type transcriptional regulator/antitoxin MqsA